MKSRRWIWPILVAVLLLVLVPSFSRMGQPEDRFQKLQDSLDLKVLLGTTTTAYPHALPPQAQNIELTARNLSGTLLEPGQTFSFNRTLGPFTAARGYKEGRTFVGNRIATSTGGGVCQVAGTLYDSVLLANLAVVTRYPHTLLVPYLPPGLDATVSEQGGKDLRFRNSTTNPVLIYAHAAGRKLTISIYGKTAGPKVTLHHEVLEWYPNQTERIQDAALPVGTEQVVAPGQAGCRVKVWMVIQTPQGETTRSLGTDTYQSSPRIVKIGTKPNAPPPVTPG